MTRDQAELIIKRIVVIGHMLDELTIVVQALPPEDEDLKRELRRGIAAAMSGLTGDAIPAVSGVFPDLHPYN